MSKHPLTYEQQLRLLQDRGLIAEDESFALHCLANYNYYRLSIYWRVFTEQDNHDRFRPGTRFDQVWELYNSLVLLIHCMQIIEPRGDWPQRLVAHLQTLPANLIPDMGFPADWQTRSIWAAVL